jgi:hypothetical protein
MSESELYEPYRLEPSRWVVATPPHKIDGADRRWHETHGISRENGVPEALRPA